MSLQSVFILAALSGVAGLVLGYLIRWAISMSKKTSMELVIKQTLLDAKTEAQRIVAEAEKKSLQLSDEHKNLVKDREVQLKKLEDRLLKKDELLDKRQLDLDRDSEQLKEKIADVRMVKDHLQGLENEHQTKLEAIAKLSEAEAKESLVAKIEKQSEEGLLQRMAKLERESAERLDRRAKDILTTAVQRLAASTASDFMTTSVQISSDEIKGKIIGKEGRNIRAFERSAGVDLIIDDTPGSIVISSFDPVRRHIAKRALESLIADGRIQPAKIEEQVEKAKAEVAKIIKEKGEAAAFECGVFNLDPRLVLILGRLYFRTSYGQNVLQHSVEMTHISAVLAEELGADVAIARAGALLHDIGKAVDHEVVGTHVEIGRRILQKLGVDERVIKAMQSHHEEYPYETLESIIVQTADAISAGRPGARRDSVENYLKRLQDLEGIANSFPGVDKSYAIQAGREVRIFVSPKEVTDLEALKMAREIANRIESELKYPGEIKVNVIRELRSIEFAR
ncbi:MAG: ribonuclease Y [Candidatus Vogelbacteria bacterium CG10_big_fil_rev_8_21_14_0_10_51_16]|uniref:Ribonuclease Y n=1 Tax=Candidatus Vogelbacteria bacterium CG10_big_fil_rev_8_21_14_0_10_51_16 TaxID=1975045 RepID=A0A2H0REY8_9BACT|nr:MAG: ribonuclease Y [Candidatus Vogelbacteria bacterium CG10_big_fil_rev_8_21_14_0_10_51_16]